MSLYNVLNTARRALSASQYGINITGHNLANATTPGYTRQRVNLAPVRGMEGPYGVIGGGVEVVGLERLRDAIIDATYRREVSFRSNIDFQRGILEQIEAAVAELTPAGVSNALSGLFDAWSELATNPAGLTQRDGVRQAASVLIQRLNNIAVRFSQIVTEVESNLGADIKRFNQIVAEIANLNRAIVKAEALGTPAADLRDARDAALDRLAELMEIRTVEQDDGSVTVIAGDAILVDRATYREIEFRLAGTTYSIHYVGEPIQLYVSGGRIGGELEILNAIIPGVTAELDAFVHTLVTEVNNLHRAGTTLSGATGIDFFDPAGVTAATIRLSNEVQASRENVVAGFTGMPGDGDVANAIAELRNTPLATHGGDTLPGAYAAFNARLGLQIENAQNVIAAQDSLITQLEQRRLSVSGVSTEEELVMLMEYQHAYLAAARVVMTADELLRSLIEMV